MAKAVLQKNWFNVQAPDIFDVEEVSETPAEKASQVEGRTIKEGLNELMDDTSKYYVDVTMKVADVEGNKAFTEIQGLECSSEFVSRLVSKRSDRFDMVHDVETEDGREVRVKVVGSTLRKTSTNTLRAVREELQEILENHAESQMYNEFMENIFMDNIQEEMGDKAEKIYPFRELEIRKTELRK
jgi:small subunit ribosomal protein S3Ae